MALERIEMTAEEIEAVEHPPLIDPSQIVSGARLGQAKVFVLRPAPIAEEERQWRRRHYAQMSWDIVLALRVRGVDV